MPIPKPHKSRPHQTAYPNKFQIEKQKLARTGRYGLWRNSEHPDRDQHEDHRGYGHGLVDQISARSLFNGQNLSL